MCVCWGPGRWEGVAAWVHACWRGAAEGRRMPRGDWQGRPGRGGLLWGSGGTGAGALDRRGADPNSQSPTQRPLELPALRPWHCPTDGLQALSEAPTRGKRWHPKTMPILEESNNGCARDLCLQACRGKRGGGFGCGEEWALPRGATGEALCSWAQRSCRARLARATITRARFCRYTL